MPPDSGIDAYLATIKQVFNIPSVLERSIGVKQIQKYYRINRLPYAFIASREGYVHMGISTDGTLKPENYSIQAETVSQYLINSNGRKVLELAPGKGANLIYLADKHPDKQFFGIDLPHAQTHPKKLNANASIEVSTGDFHDLSSYATASFDVVFIIEALCYSSQHSKVFKEVSRILTPGGYFIIFDGYNGRPFKDMSVDEATATKLAWKGMMIDPNNMHLGKVLNELGKTNFQIVKTQDLSREILPSLYHFQRLAIKFFHHPKLAKIVVRLLPSAFTANVISGYLMPILFEQGLATYNLIVAQSDK